MGCCCCTGCFCCLFPDVLEYATAAAATAAAAAAGIAYVSNAAPQSYGFSSVEDTGPEICVLGSGPVIS
jgi:hypothetical protein